MKKNSSKAIVTILLTVVITIAAVAQQNKERRPAPKPTNLKVLPMNIEHDSLINLMKEYSVSLGVHCNYCHAKSADGQHLDFASDDNDHKKVARYMIQMTSGINDQYFKEENGGDHGHTALMVRCFTCHHGNKEPQAFVMPAEEDHH